MDNNATYDINDLLVKYLLQEANAEEQQRVNDWLQQGEENRRYFNHLSLIWNESSKLAAVSTVDENEAWQSFKQRVDKKEPVKVIAVPKPSPWPLRIAAALIGITLISSVYWFVNKNRPEIATIKSGSDVLKENLADGSVITLNKNSSIVYDKKLKGATRNIALTGEAFFEVAPDKNKPFIITVNDVTIRVVGTSFNVKSSNGNTEVNVKSGVVEIIRQSEKVSLRAKEKVIVETSNQQLQKDSTRGELYDYYKTKVFVCDNTPLWQLVATLNEAYGADIIIENNSIRSLPLSVTFNEEPIDKILAIVTQTLSITAAKKDNQIVLR